MKVAPIWYICLWLFGLLLAVGDTRRPRADRPAVPLHVKPLPPTDSEGEE